MTVKMIRKNYNNNIIVLDNKRQMITLHNVYPTENGKRYELIILPVYIKTEHKLNTKIYLKLLAKPNLHINLT